jgi:hypothetical protein
LIVCCLSAQNIEPQRHRPHLPIEVLGATRVLRPYVQTPRADANWCRYLSRPPAPVERCDDAGIGVYLSGAGIILGAALSRCLTVLSLQIKKASFTISEARLGFSLSHN